MGKVEVRCEWTVREKRGGLWVPVRQRHNLFTDSGLSALASAISGGYSPPVYLILEQNYTTLTTGGAAGMTSLALAANITYVADTQLVLEPGTPSQEIVTFSATNGAGTYTLSSATLKAHLTGAKICRQVRQADTMSNVMSESQFDPVNAANLRLKSTGGYSQGAGNWVAQFYLSNEQANFFMCTMGLSENGHTGLGVLHNHLVIGYEHTASTQDIQIDASLTLANA